MSELTPNEVRRMNWYIKAMATDINYAVDDSIDRILQGKKFLQAAGWGKARLTSAGIDTCAKLSQQEEFVKHNHLIYARAPSTVKAYLKKQNMILVAHHALNGSIRANSQQAG